MNTLLASATVNKTATIRHGYAKILSFVALIFVILSIGLCLCPKDALAQNVTVDAKKTSYADTNLSAKVTYDDDIRPGQPVTFTFIASGGNYEIQYLVNSFTVTANGTTTNVMECDRFAYSTNNTFQATLVSAGTYSLAFYISDFKDNGNRTKKQTDSARFQITFVVDDTDQFDSVQAKVDEIYSQFIGECGTNASDYETALWFNDWLIRNATYDQDMLYGSAEGVLLRGKGTCESFHAAYELLLNKAGIETRRVDSYGDKHVWTGAKLDGEWYNIDVTWNDFALIFDGLDTSKLYFAVPSNIMKLVHKQWDGTYLVSYPDRAVFDAHSYEDNYFIHSGAINTYTKSYLDPTNETYGVQRHLDNQETSFKLPIEKASWPPDYKNVIYTLAAYQLEQESWGDSVSHLSVSYVNGDSENDVLKNDYLEFSVTYKTTGPVQMHRLYNPFSGEHFYTSSTSERNDVVAAGWLYEGVGWTAPTTGDPVYRLYNPYGGEHHYTLSTAERNTLIQAGWTDEGIGWYSDPNKSVPVYRQYNPNAFANNHNYTTSISEHNGLISLGWKDEGIAWYGVNPS